MSDFRFLSDLTEGAHFLRRRNADEFFHFAFTDYFFHALGSDRSSLSVSYGVAASGAFPLLIDYVPLTNYRNCLREGIADRAKCERDRKEQLALIDGGANDNQGVAEIYALLGELLLKQARSDNSADKPLEIRRPDDVGTPPPARLIRPGKAPETMRSGDRALLITVNSAITEATGIAPGAKSPPWLLGNIVRSTGAVDVYSGTEVDLRRRLYMQNLDVVNETFRRLPNWGYGPVSAIEIGLLTLDRYSEGGPEGTAVRRSGIRLPPNLDCTDPRFDRIACEIYAKSVPAQDAAWKKLREQKTRDALMLSPMHPQCLFEQSKLADGLLEGLMELSRPVADCLRHAARWATALRVQELCARIGAETPINERAALGCGANGVLAPGKIALLKGAGGRDLLDACRFDDNSADDNKTILRHLAANKTFLSENPGVLPRAMDALSRAADGLPAAELARRLNNVCNLDHIQAGNL